MLSHFGLRLVRWPRQLRSDDELPDKTRFFPIGTPQPWVIPEDLRENPAPWARVLVSLYEDHASWPSSIVPEGGMLLHALVRNIRPRTIVETGTCLGASTIWMASAMMTYGGDLLHTFDLYSEPPDERLASSALFRDRKRGVEARLAQAGVAERVRIHEGDSAERLVAMREELLRRGGVQLAFIDGDHSPHGVVADLHALEPALQIGGYVILHDTFPEVCNHIGPRWLLDHLNEVASGRYQVCEIYTAQTNYGLALLRRIE